MQLDVLRGAEKILGKVQMVLLDVYTHPFRKGACTEQEVEAFFKQSGYRQIGFWHFPMDRKAVAGFIQGFHIPPPVKCREAYFPRKMFLYQRVDTSK